MGGKESSLKDQAWCSNSNLYCKNCVTEVENVNTEVKRTSPMPKTELQQLIRDQKQQQRYQGSNSNQTQMKNKQQSQQQQQFNQRGGQVGQVQNTQMSTQHTSGHPQNTYNNNNSVSINTFSKSDHNQQMLLEQRQQVLKELVGKAPRLELKVLSSAFLEKGEVIYINPLGLEDGKSLRKADDGFTYFGCKKSIRKPLKQNQTNSNQSNNPNTNQQIMSNNGNIQVQMMGATGTSIEEMNDSKSMSFDKEIVNDFVIPTKNEEEKEKHRGRQFQIYFDPESMKYKIKDLGVGYGAFVKLTRPIVLRDNFLLNMGESYIVANLFKSQDDLIGVVGVNKVPMKLRLKIFSVVKADQPDVFSFQNELQEIIIGRTPNCDIRIEDKLLSKAQATIRFDGENWVLTDGFEGRESTNGTWLYLNEDCDIENGMVFKSNQTFFEASLIN